MEQLFEAISTFARQGNQDGGTVMVYCLCGCRRRLSWGQEL